MQLIKKLAVFAVMVAGFAMISSADTAEAGHHRHFKRFHYGHNHYRYNYYKPHYYRYNYHYAPVRKYYYCDIHSCYYYIDSYGKRFYLR